MDNTSKPRIKTREKDYSPIPRRSYRKRRAVGKPIEYSSDVRRRKRREGHYKGSDLKVWMLFWDMNPRDTAKILNTTARNVRDVIRREKYLPQKMDNILKGIWFQNPKIFPKKNKDNRVYFKVQKSKQWWGIQDAYNWGLEIKDLYFIRDRGRGCSVVHRPTGKRVYFRDGSDFDYNRRWAMKLLADKYYGMVTIRENNERLRDIWRNTLRKETGITETKGWTRNRSVYKSINGERVNPYGIVIAEPDSKNQR